MKHAEPKREEPAKKRYDELEGGRRLKVTELVILAVTAFIAAGAALTGAWVANDAAQKTLRTQLEFEDRTRYQEQRLDTYTAFLDNAHTLVAFGKFERPLKGAHREVFADTITTFNTSFRRLQLAAGPRVRKLAHDLHALMLPFARGEYSTEEQRSGAQAAYVNKLRELLIEMRLELGTEPASAGEKSEEVGGIDLGAEALTQGNSAADILR